MGLSCLEKQFPGGRSLTGASAVGELGGKVQLLLMINQIQELCPALESLFPSLLFLPFACLLSPVYLWINLIFHRGIIVSAQGGQPGIHGWALPAGFGCWEQF